MKRVSPQWLFVVLLVAAFGVRAHEIAPPFEDPLAHAPTQPAAGAPLESVTGSLHRLVIDDRVAGITLDEYSLQLDDGRVVALRGIADRVLATGDRVEASGRRNGNALFVSAIRPLSVAGPRTGQARRELRGKLALLHVDYFDAESRFVLEVQDAAGDGTPLALPRIPDSLARGMRVTVSGVTAPDGFSLAPDTITIEALPTTSTAKATLAATVNDKVLVILMTFTDSPTVPFSQAQVQSVFAGGAGSGSVVQYFSEASFGQQLMTPTITNWLSTNSATPSGCNYTQMGTLGRTAATNAGYSVGSYQKIVYVFPRVSSCGWTGLGYVGSSGAWINGANSTSVYGHELGHNYGLSHAGSLRCSGGAVIGGSCSVSEYGDPFSMMGNQGAMHYNAPEKSRLGWIASGNVVTHTSGQATYTLSPLELGGGSIYAVKVPAASNRTYWLEYRQPIGFDSGLSKYPNNGVQVRVASPFETLCGGCSVINNDTQLLDMTPATGAFTDGALLVGQRFTDPNYGVSFNVVSANASGVTVTVAIGGSPPAATSTALASSPNPSTAGNTVIFTASVTGTSPTGTVAFSDGGSTISGCAAATLSGSGNTRTATCATSALTAGTHAITARYGGDGANAASSSATLSQAVNAAANPTVWVEDSVPAGATQSGTGESWTWVSSNPASYSGASAHQSALASGLHQHTFYNASTTMTVGVGESLYAYVYLDPANPPSEVMLQWNDGTWEHRAYWGANLVSWGTNGTTSRRYMGALPAAGQWVKLSVPASAVGLEGRTLNGMAFTLYNGRATWDQAGRSTSTSSPGPTVWVEDSVPAGAVQVGQADGWTWVTGNPTPFSGASAHQSALVSGTHQHYFYNAPATLSVAAGETLYAYVYLDAANPPSEVMLQWNDGTWEHRAYWGANLIGWGADGTVSRRYMGALPAAGQWVKLSVPGSAVGLENRAVNGIAFTLYNGRATWDQAGKF